MGMCLFYSSNQEKAGSEIHKPTEALVQEAQYKESWKVDITANFPIADTDLAMRFYSAPSLVSADMG
jgi:hypothetical protein